MQNQPKAASAKGSLLIAVLVALPGVLAAALVLFGGFTWGLPDASHIQSYHPDEQNVTRSLRNMNPRELDFNPRFFGNPTFHTYQIGAAALAASTAGILPRETSEEYWVEHPEAVRRFYILGRGVSLVYALLSLVLIYRIAAGITGKRWAGIAAAVLFFSTPVFAVHSNYMTVNSSSVFWSLAAVIFAFRLRENPSWKNYLLSALFAGLAISTKLNNAFLPLAILTAHLQARGSKGLLRSLLSRKLITAAAVTVLAFFAASPYFLLSMTTVRESAHNKMNFTALFDFSKSPLLLMREFWDNFSGGLGEPLSILFIFAIIAAFFRGRKKLAPILSVAAPFFLLAVKSGYWAFPSRMLPLLALLTVILAVVISDLAKKSRRTAGWALVALALVATIPWNVAYWNLMRTEHVRAESSRWIVENIPEGKKIIVLDTPYFESPDVIYERALHPGLEYWGEYDIRSLGGDFNTLGQTSGDWLVISWRYDRKLRESIGIGIDEYTAGHGFGLEKSFERRFESFGREMRSWLPADMVQNYPVFIYKRKTKEAPEATP